MAERKLIYQAYDVITSFSTRHPKALIKKVPWVISKSTKITDAVSRIFDDGYADLMVLDPQTGGVLGLLSDLDNTTTLSSKEKKKKKKKKKSGEITIQQQVDCHTMCVTQCATRGGCKNHAVAYNDDGVPYCMIQCNDNLEETVGGALSKGKQM